eukprot:5265939-Pyramimonas_sp.AAC.1
MRGMVKREGIGRMCALGRPSQVLKSARAIMGELGDLMVEKSPSLAGMQKQIFACRDVFLQAKKLKVLQP